MENNISSLVQRQIPEHLRDTAPLFISFLETYYEYAQQRTNSVGLIQYHRSNTDIDFTLDSYVNKFYSTYGPQLPLELAVDKRNFIKLLNSIYTAKGTEKAFKLLFRVLFNEDVSITTPSDQILKASDGVWSRESFFTTDILFGTVDNIENKIVFSNQWGNFYIESTRYEFVSPTKIRFYYNSISKIRLDVDQIFFIKNSDNTNKFVGGLVKSPQTLKIKEPGTSWQVGQVIVIPGTVKNTIARVVGINSVGGITGIEILEFGYEHSPNQTTYVSPYPNKPLGSIVNTTSTLISINPDVYDHQITIGDFTDGISESISGVVSGIGNNSYFLQDYVETGYTGLVVLAEQSFGGSTITQQLNESITIEDWIRSRAVFTYIDGDITLTKGYYKNDSGQLSNQSIRLQDNYYYQVFSYVVESTRDSAEYSGALKLIHPAGLKSFSKLYKTADITVDVQTSRTKSYDTAFLLDILGQSTDYSTINFSKIVYDQAYTSDQINYKLFGKTLQSSQAITDTAFISSIKYITDIVTAESNNTSSLITTEVDSYDMENFFLEDYIEPAFNFSLTIG